MGPIVALAIVDLILRNDGCEIHLASVALSGRTTILGVPRVETWVETLG